MITVFTPTYNRGYILHRLYESLCRQRFHDFEWIVVDDGSTDNTPELLRECCREERINLRVFHQENSGKHIAINKGVQEARGELFFIVDSDDYLSDNALETMWRYYQDIRDDARFVGLSGVRATPDGKRIGGEVDFETLDCHIMDFFCKYHYQGDMAEAYKTSVMRRFPFPVIPGEKFCCESLIWNRIAQVGVLRYTNEKWYICEYRPDGLTAHITQVRMRSPRYAMLLYAEQARYRTNTLFKLKSLINFWRFAVLSRTSWRERIAMAGWAALPLLLPGYLLHLHDTFKQ